MKTLIYFLTAILFPLFVNHFYFERVDIKIDQIKEQSIVVIYDDFSKPHGEIISDLILNEVNASDYKLLKLDTKEYRIPVIEKILIELASIKGRKIYFNNSNNPSNSLGCALKTRLYKNLYTHKNIHIFQSAGNNNIEIVKFIQRYTHVEKIAQEINEKIYTELCSNLDDIKAVGRNKGIENLLYLGNTWGIILGNFYRLIFNPRDSRIEQIVESAVNNILINYSNFNINKKELISLYSLNLHQFLFAYEIQNNKTNVLIVGSNSNFSLTRESEILYSLNCPIEGLVDYEVLDEGYWIDHEGMQHTGTSFSSPLYLASVFNKKH